MVRQSGLDNKARPLINPDEFMGLIRRGIVREVRTNRDIVVEFGSGSNFGNRVTIPSTRVYTFSGRYRELPHVGDTCLIAFVNGRPGDAAIIGFNSGDYAEHDSFDDVEDRRENLPGGGSIRILGIDGSVNIEIPSDVSLVSKGDSPGITLETDGDILSNAARAFIVNARYFQALIYKILDIESENVVINNKLDIGINAGGNITVKSDEEVTIDGKKVGVGGKDGRRAARVGDEITIPIGTTITLDSNNQTKSEIVGAISTDENNGSSTVLIVD